jgi:hypothetical protein
MKKKIKKVIAREELRTDVLQSITNVIINPTKSGKNSGQKTI